MAETRWNVVCLDIVIPASGKPRHTVAPSIGAKEALDDLYMRSESVVCTADGFLRA